MAAKRNSRAYLCEDAARQDVQQQLPTSTSYRSRRSSRSSTKDEAVKESDDISIREATNLVRGQNTLTITRETTNNTTRSGETMPSNMSVSSMSTMSTTSTASSETSSSPYLDRPHNFGIVVPGVYRSSYPKNGDFEYIKGLKLKTLVTLVKKDELDQELQTFVTNNGIRQVIFNMKGTKKEAIPIKTMKAILSIILDRQNHPLLIHCNHGKHRTGCVVGVVRKVSGWDTQSVVDEYRSYAEPKIRECDVQYLEAFQISSLREVPSLRQSGDWALGRSPSQQKTFFRALIFSMFIVSLWMISSSQMSPVTAVRPDRLL